MNPAHHKQLTVAGHPLFPVLSSYETVVTAPMTLSSPLHLWACVWLMWLLWGQEKWPQVIWAQEKWLIIGPHWVMVIVSQILIIKEQISLFVGRTFLVWTLKAGSWFFYFCKITSLGFPWFPLTHLDHPPCLQIGSPSPGHPCRAHLPVSPFLAYPIPYGGKHSHSCFLDMFAAVCSQYP